MHLEYTPLGEGEECESIGDAEALMGFLRLFRIDRTRAEIVGEGHAVRGFEQEMRKDSDRLLGRREVIGTLERVVRETAHGLIWVSGKAGVGKSFVMSRVAIDLLEEGPEGWLILPYRFRIVDSRCSRESFLRFARERLDSWLDRPFEEGVAERVSGERSQPIDRLKDSLEAQPADRRVLFILDGLDEITERDPEFAREIPLALRQHNVLWVCCGRPQDGLQEAFRGAKAIEPFTDGLPRMSMDDIREILVEKLGPLRRRLLRGDRDEGDKVVNRFVERVAKNAEGLPIYVKYVVGDVLNGLLAPEAPGQLPSSLSQYHAELLRRLQVGDLHQILTPLAVTLAVAREPLTVEKLTALLSRRSFVKPDEAGVALVAKAMSAIESMVRLAPDPDGGEGYTLWHESLREHMFTSPDVSIAIATARQAMADAGLRPSGDAAERYLYRQGVGHLLEERRRDEALDLLSESEYVYSRLATLKGLRPFSGLALDWVAWLMPSQDRETLEKSARMFRARLDVLCATVPRVAERTWLELLGHIVVWELAPRLRMHLGGQLALAHVLPYANRILEHLLGLEPNNRKVLRDLGVTYDLLGGLVKRTDAMQARDWFEKSNTIAERLAELEPDNLVFLRDLGISNDRLGELVADTDVTQARRWHEKSLAVRERLVALEPDNLDYRRDLTLSYDNIGELVGRTDATQARDSYEKALAIRKRLVAFAPDNLDYLHCLSKSYTRLGELVSGTEIGEARGWYEYGLAIRERITELEPNNIVYLQDLSVSYERLGNLLAAADSAKARDLYRKGCSIQERLLTLEPDNSSYLRSLSGFLQGLGDLERGTDIFKARGLYEKSLAIRERLAALQPDNRVYLHHLSVSCERLAALMADDDSRQACHWYLKAAEIAERLETLDPESLLTYMHFRGALYSRLGDLMAAADTAQARNWYQKAAEIAERTADLDPESVTHAIYRDWLYVKLGELLRGTDAAAARVWYEKGLAITERLATLEPDNVTYLRGLSVSYERLGDLAVRTEAAAAYGWYEKALTIRERLATHGACDPADLDKMSWAYHRMGDAEERAGNAAVAREWRMKQLHVRQTLAALQPRSISIRRDMSIALFNLGCLDAKLGDSTAGSWFDQAIALRRELVGELPNDPDLWERLARACYERMALALQQRQPSEAQPFEQECTAALDRASALAPQRSSVRYLRACVLAVTGEPAAALDALAQASELGWDDADEALKERDFESLRELPRFNELIEGMRRNKAAGQQT